MKNRNRNRIISLALVVTLVALIVLGVTIFALFLSVAEQNKRMMISFAESQAGLLQSVIKLDPAAVQHSDSKPPTEVLEHIRSTLKRNPIVITDSGELMFAYRDQGYIHFLSNYRFGDKTAMRILEDDPQVGPMLLALKGHSGVMVGKDYRDTTVLSAFVPVEGVNVGVVVKIDMKEVQYPFIKTAIIASITTFFVILIGTIVVQRISNPLVQRLEENESKYRTLFDSANEGILVISDRIDECNDQVCRLLGYAKAEMIGRRIVDFTPEHQPEGDKSITMTTYMLDQAKQGKPQYFIWRSKRKDGVEIDVDVMLKAIEVGKRSVVLATLLDVTDRLSTRANYHAN